MRRVLLAVGLALLLLVHFEVPAAGQNWIVINGVSSLAARTFRLFAGALAGQGSYTPGGTLYWENTAASTSAGSTNFVTGTAYSIPAGTLAANGDRFILRASVTLGTAATDNKNLRCNIGYTSVAAGGTFTGGTDVIAESTASNTGTISWSAIGVVTRLSATTGSYEWYSIWNSNATTQGAAYAALNATTWANANNFLCEVGNTTVSNTEVLTLNEYRLSFEPR